VHVDSYRTMLGAADSVDVVDWSSVTVEVAMLKERLEGGYEGKVINPITEDLCLLKGLGMAGSLPHSLRFDPRITRHD
jgi:hypothetical protein